MTLDTESDEERRCWRRALIRTCHPERGGARAEFSSTLRRLNDAALTGSTSPDKRFARRRRRWQGWGNRSSVSTSRTATETGHLANRARVRLVPLSSLEVSCTPP
jgi:hypothetical protein